MRLVFPCLLLLALASPAHPQAAPPIHLWLEPEWFDGVRGSFAYWTGEAKPTGAWGIAGPGISAEWTQGGESEWNSMGAAAAETKAECRRPLTVPRAGKYHLWVRYVDHRKKTEPFRVHLEQTGKIILNSELGTKDVLPPGDEYQLWWGFSFAWDKLPVTLAEGPANLRLLIDRAGEGWRQLDAVLLTDDLDFIPQGREKPAFAYYSSFALEPPDGAKWRGSARGLKVGGDWKRPPVGGKDFSMWAGADPDLKWWAKQDLAKLSLSDVLFQFGPHADIREKFHKDFAGRRDLPILSSPLLTLGFHLGGTPDLSPDSPLRQWLERTKTPFYIMTNYATGNYKDKDGPATFAALQGPLKNQFLGYIHGEALGTGGVGFGEEPLGKTRREHVDAIGKTLLKKQAEGWSAIYKTKVPESHMEKTISCLSVDSISLAHLFHEIGCKTVGYEIDATNAHAPMRIAFERGAARQYGGAWIHYASGNFGDACNYFTQNPIVPRGAPAWFHSKYSITDGVSAAWYRKLYYLNYLGGASAVYWEQSLGNQWILPGPGTHPIQLSPFGRGTEDFMAFVRRLPDRGEPFTPIGILLSHGHAYDRINYRARMLHSFLEDDNDRELRELFNVCWHPIPILEGQPAAPDKQSMPSGVHGDIFDVLVDRPARARAILNYPVLWAAGDVDLGPAMQPALKEYLGKGGTLVVHAANAGPLPSAWLGLALTGKTVRSESWSPADGKALPTPPCQVAAVHLKGAEVLATAGKDLPLITRQKIGDGAVLTILVPHLLGLDERAHPALPWLMNGLMQDLLPIEVRLADGKRPAGEVMYQLNRTNKGWLVSLFNHHGIDKTQTGLARVDRRAFVDVVLRTKLPVKTAREWTADEEVRVERNGEWTEVRVRVHPGDVRVVGVE